MQISTTLVLTSLLLAIIGLAGLYLLFRRGLSLPRGSAVSKAFHYGFPIGSVLVVGGLAVALVASTSPTPVGTSGPPLPYALVDGGVAIMLVGLVLIVGILLAIIGASIAETYR